MSVYVKVMTAKLNSAPAINLTFNENELRNLIKQIIKEENLYHNEIYSIQPEGRFWIVTYRSFNDGTKEKVFTSEE